MANLTKFNPINIVCSNLEDTVIAVDGQGSSELRLLPLTNVSLFYIDLEVKPIPHSYHKSANLLLFWLIFTVILPLHLLFLYTSLQLAFPDSINLTALDGHQHLHISTA